MLAARNRPAAPSRSTKWASDWVHLSSGSGTGSSFGGAMSPFFRILRVFLQVSLVQPMYLPKRPFLSCISEPQRSHSMLGPS
ncbi:hypothetical protein D3C84_535370 [compost metagenome]